MAMQSVNPYEQYENDIKKAYEQVITIEEAQCLAAKFLYAGLQISAELKVIDLDARMRKTGVKAIKAGVYLEESKRGDKKPTEATLSALVDSSKLVQDSQGALDQSEVAKEELQRLFSVFHEAHVYYRGIAKGSFGG